MSISPGSTTRGSPTKAVTAWFRGGALEYGVITSLGRSLTAAGIKEGAMLDGTAMGSVRSTSLAV